MHDKVDITLTVNGRAHAIRVEPRKTLADAIREDCGQTGTNIGCEHGVCGACTVIVDGEAVRSCLMFAVQAEGRPIRTVEGLEKNPDITDDDLIDLLSSNLCRCTGYQNIISAVRAAAADARRQGVTPR